MIRRSRGGLGFLRYFLEARLFNLGEVQFADVRARGTSLRANAAAPSVFVTTLTLAPWMTASITSGRSSSVSAIRRDWPAATRLRKTRPDSED